jgi:hypothetical protein
MNAACKRVSYDFSFSISPKAGRFDISKTAGSR